MNINDTVYVVYDIIIIALNVVGRYLDIVLLTLTIYMTRKLILAKSSRISHHHQDWYL